MMPPGGDQQSARSLPDEYAQLRAPSGPRVLELVGRKWGDRPEGERRELAQILMLILEPLQRPGAQVTEEMRGACEHAVADWIQKTVSVGDLIEGAPDYAHGSTLMTPKRGRRAVKLVAADTIALDGTQCSARITLERGIRRYAVNMACNMDVASQLRGGASATIGALRQIVGDTGPGIELREVGTFDAFHRPGVIVSVAVIEGSRTETLIGVHPDIGTEPVRAAALGVLNALNRRLGIG